MKFGFTLDKEQVKALIEMIETHRCEGESKVCSDVRTSIKKQYQTQYMEAKEAMNEEDVIDASKIALGPNYCDSCD
tara:strand:- start:117 stop:344 length:228 start_codon:yes stop_codon:yes gene_type:complete